MDIMISNASGKPIYEQIYSAVRGMIVSGSLAPGELLPSIRTLAKDLRISVITTKHAYDDLERDGFIYTVAGKGCYVAEKNVELIREDDRKRIEELMREAALVAKNAGIPRAELEEIFFLTTMEGIE